METNTPENTETTPVNTGETHSEQYTRLPKAQLDAMIAQNKELKSDLSDAVSLFAGMFGIIEPIMGLNPDNIGDMMKLGTKLPALIGKAKAMFTKDSEAFATGQRLFKKYEKQIEKAYGKEIPKS